MKVEIDLPEFAGYEYTGGYRPPQKGEWYLPVPEDIGPQLAPENWVRDCRFILRPVKPPLVFPDELLAWNIAGIAMDQSGYWCAYQYQPYKNEDCWDDRRATATCLPKEQCPWLPDTTGYEWHETWISHPGRE